MDSLKNPYAMVFGSTTLHSTGRNLILDKESFKERTMNKAPRLGHDIQYLFVPGDNAEQTRTWLEKMGLGNKVRVHGIAELERAIEVSQLAFRHYVDIAALRRTHSGIIELYLSCGLTIGKVHERAILIRS